MTKIIKVNYDLEARRDFDEIEWIKQQLTSQNITVFKTITDKTGYSFFIEVSELPKQLINEWVEITPAINDFYSYDYYSEILKSFDLIA